MKTARTGFTLIEVMIAIAFIGIAMTALLALHHTNLRAVIHAQELTRAAMLAQGLMSQAELERFPAVGRTHGNFTRLYANQYPNYRWIREVQQSPLFPDIEKIRVTVQYGPRFIDSFSLTEFIRNPLPPMIPGTGD